jgi:uncharacterized protein DUF5818
MKRSTCALLTMLLGLWLLSAGLAQTSSQMPDAAAQTSPPHSTPPTFPSPEAKQQPAGEEQPTSTTPVKSRVFMGTVVKQKGSYVLEAGGLSYKLDDQSKAKEYEGKAVKVTGRMDKPNNTIHVEEIEISPTS